jgi:hypothetical protein
MAGIPLERNVFRKAVPTPIRRDKKYRKENQDDFSNIPTADGTLWNIKKGGLKRCGIIL